MASLLAVRVPVALGTVAHGNDVGIVAHHEDGVLESLAFGRA